MQKDDCIFCKIVRGEVPTTKVYEDDHVLAFEDAEPQMPIHVLIVPKDHYDGMSDNVPAEVFSEVFSAVPKVAALKGVDATGYRTLVNTGDDAQQFVHHLHVHVLGGAPMNSGDPSIQS